VSTQWGPPGKQESQAFETGDGHWAGKTQQIPSASEEQVAGPVSRSCAQTAPLGHTAFAAPAQVEAPGSRHAPDDEAAMALAFLRQSSKYVMPSQPHTGSSLLGRQSAGAGESSQVPEEDGAQVAFSQWEPEGQSE